MPASPRLLLACVALWGLAACATDIAQTAEFRPGGRLDCSSPGELALPSEAPFGDGVEPVSSLLGQGYTAGQGPGLFVSARDAFRVYLDGELLVESTVARSSVFVPLTLLPGDNALSVVVAAKSGTPAALLQLDELDASYVSDATWKVSSSPGVGFMSSVYDASDWADATDLGEFGSLPGCDPERFAEGSAAHWIGPVPGSGSTAVLRTVIHIAPTGFGAGTTGGAGAPATLVDNWDDLQAAASDPQAPALILLAEGEHDFRTAPRTQMACPATCTNDATKTQYSVLIPGATCNAALVPRTRSERSLSVGSNKTIVGLGRGALLRGVTFDLGASENVVLRNLTFYDVSPDLIEAGDALRMTGASQVWVDHATVKWISDDFTSVRSGTKNVTFSWLHYDGVSASDCRGQHTRGVDITAASMTLHHCFFDHVESHSPTVHDASSQVHLYDNLLSDNPGYAVGSVCGAQVLMEANTLQRVATPTERSFCPDDTGIGLIDAPAGSNFYDADVGAHHGGDGKEPHDAVFEPSYGYTLEPPEGEWLLVLSRAGAGGRWSLPLSLD